MSGYKGILRKPQLLLYLVGLWISIFVQQSACFDDEKQTSSSGLPTVTVRGFLNFKTTVDGTVIVFTPVSEPQAPASIKTTTKPTLSEERHTLSTNNNNAILEHSNSLKSKDAIPVNNIQDLTFTQSPAMLDALKPDLEDLDRLGQKDKETFLHISDNAVLPSSIQTDNDLVTELNPKSPSSHNLYPTGLVTVLDGTHVEDSKTTVFETRVMGTYIDGKYAQILQSTSKIIAPTIVSTAPHIEDSATKTTVASSPTTAVTTAPSTSTYTKSASSTQSTILLSAANEITTPSSVETSTLESILKPSTNNELTKSTSSVILQSSFQVPEMTVKPSTSKPTQSLESVKTNTFSKYTTFDMGKPTTMRSFDTDDSMLLSSKHLRISSSRIRFTAPKRHSQTVRLNRFKVRLTLRQNSTDGFELTTPPEDEDLEEEEHSKEEEEPSVELPTDILDPASVVYQETTITSEVTLHVGRRKSVRTLTITTSVPKRVNPTDFDGIAMTHGVHDVIKDHEAQENAPAIHSVMTRTYTTTERTQTTSIVPVHDGTTTSLHTLTESFFIMKIITAYRTLPPGDFTVLDPSTTDSLYFPGDISATTLDVAANDQPSIMQPPQEQQTIETVLPVSEIITESPLPTPAIVPHNVNKDATNPLLSFGQALSNNPLAAVYLGLQQLNAQMTLYSTVTQLSTYVTTDTIYSTKTIRFYDGRSTKFRTTSEPISMTKRTVTSTVTSVQPYINTQAYQQQQQLQKLIAATQNQQPRFSTLTSVYTTSTTATSLSTRIYTLIYNGFSTKFRTVTSTKLYPTVLTVTSTKEVPLTPTQPPILPFAYPYPAA